MALDFLPTDAAEELKKYAINSSLEVAKIRCRRHKRKEADADGSEAKKNLATFKEKCEELLSEGSCKDIAMMLRCSGWHAANTRKSEESRRHESREGYKSDADENEREVEEHYQDIIRRKEISGTLASNLKDMGYCIARSVVNSIFRPHEEEAEDKKAILDSLFDKIHGEVDVAQILSQRPAEEPLKLVGEVPLEILPCDIANELKLYAEYQSLHCAKKRFRNGAEADADRMKAKDHYDSFQEKCKGLLSDCVCQNIRELLMSAAWHEANIKKSKQCLLPKLRDRYKSDASTDKKGVDVAYKAIVEAGEISETLARNLREMGWNVARHAVSKIAGRDDDAIRDTANVDLYFRNVNGAVNLVSMKFIMDEAKILKKRQLEVCEQYLQNKTDIQQSMVFSFTVTEGKTHSTSHTVGFSYGIESSFSAGFSNFSELNFSFDFNFSCNRTFEESINTVITKAYEFPLFVPAYSKYVAKGIVQEAEMEIPYELMFDLKGVRRSVKGLWKGVAKSKASYEIEKTEGPPTSCSIV